MLDADGDDSIMDIYGEPKAVKGGGMGDPCRSTLL